MMVGSTRNKDSRESWIFLAITGFVIGYAAGPVDNFGILVVVFVDYYNETNTKIGWAGSLLVSSVCFSFPFAVRLQHRFGFRAIAITSGILIIISFLTTPLIPSANYLFVSYCIPYGIGVGFMDCISITILPEFFDKYLGLAIGMRFASVSIGSMINSYLFPILIESIGWKKMFYCFSSTGAAYLIYAFFYKTKATIPTDREVVEAKDCDIVVTNDVCELSTDRLHILRDRGFQLIVIGCLPFFFAVNVPLMFMVQYAKTLGYHLSQSKWLVVGHGLGSLIGRIAMGLVGDFATRRKITVRIASIVVSVFGLASGACSFTQYLPLMILYMAGCGMLAGIFWVILPLMMNDLTGGIHADYAYSLMVVLVATGFLIGPSSMGKVFDNTGDFRIVLYIVCGCGVVAGVIITLGIHFKSQRSHMKNSRQTKENTCLPKILTLKVPNLATQKQHEIISKLEKYPLVQYETAV